MHQRKTITPLTLLSAVLPAVLLAVLGLTACDAAQEDGQGKPVQNRELTCTAAVTVDGNAADWGADEPTLADAPGDGGTYSGLDLTGVYVGCDGASFFLRLERAALALPGGEGHNFWTYFNADTEGGPSFAIEAYHDAAGTLFPRLWDTTGAAGYAQYALLLAPIPAVTSTQTLEFSWPRAQVSLAVPYRLEFYTHHTVGGVWGDNGDSNETITRLTIAP